MICVFISDDNLSEDDIKECEKEDALQEDDDVPHPEQFNKTKKKANSKLRLELKLHSTNQLLQYSCNILSCDFPPLFWRGGKIPAPQCFYVVV